MSIIISGVIVFVVSQFILKLVLEPIVSFKQSLGSFMAFCLRNKAPMTNRNASEEMQNELKDIISSLIFKQYLIPCYKVFSLIGFLPKENNIREACLLLNGISYSINKDTAQNSGDILEVFFELNKVSTLLGVRLDY
jgi:hypothetical protein